ncbi:MAG: ribbon-helix-helix protein, CopG family [Thermoanaerobaculaceae bacterium]
MNAMTVRGLDESDTARLKQEARRRGVSVNALLKLLVRQGLGIERRSREERHTELDALAGTWSDEDAARFERAVEPFEQVEPELWR